LSSDVAIHFWQNFNCASVADMLAVISHPRLTPFPPPTDAFAAPRRLRGGASAGRGPVSISGEVLEAGIELSFTRTPSFPRSVFRLLVAISG
jgi:hypothetical protein